MIEPNPAASEVVRLTHGMAVQNRSGGAKRACIISRVSSRHPNRLSCFRRGHFWAERNSQQFLVTDGHYFRMHAADVDGQDRHSIFRVFGLAGLISLRREAIGGSSDCGGMNAVIALMAKAIVFDYHDIYSTRIVPVDALFSEGFMSPIFRLSRRLGGREPGAVSCYLTRYEPPLPWGFNG